MGHEIVSINRILEEVRNRNGIDGLALNLDGVAGIQLKSGIKIFFEYREPVRKLHIHLLLMPLSKDQTQRLALQESMLTYNFIHLGRGPGMLAVCPAMEEAVCQIGLDIATLDADALDKALRGLIDQRDDVLHHLSNNMKADSALHVPQSMQSTYGRLAIAARISAAKMMG